MNLEAFVPAEQLSLFATDYAGEVARAFTDLAWRIVEHRRHLTPDGYAHLMGECALAHERLDALMRRRTRLLEVPPVARSRAKIRARLKAGEIPVQFSDERPAYARRPA